MSEPTIISDDFIQKNTSFEALIEVLKTGFARQKIVTPQRHHHSFQGMLNGKTSTLLLMPAWQTDEDLGVKIVTVNPNNQQLPTVQGTYLLMDATNGSTKAIFDAKALTNKRTAAASALASSFLSRSNSSSLLMIGTGNLAPALIQAHAAIRPIQQVYVWGRHYEKAVSLAQKLEHFPFEIQAVQDIEDVIQKVDIISCATLSEQPLVFGKYLKAGQHLDLVGAYQANTRESDDESILKSSIFVDCKKAAIKEAGDIVIPLQKGIIEASDIVADLFDLCNHNRFARQNNEEITLFKSVGHALEDLVAAQYYYSKFIQS